MNFKAKLVRSGYSGKVEEIRSLHFVFAILEKGDAGSWNVGMGEGWSHLSQSYRVVKHSGIAGNPTTGKNYILPTLPSIRSSTSLAIVGPSTGM